MNKERRKSYRMELLSEACGWSIVGSPKKTPNKIINISTEGMFVESESNPQGELEIVLTLPGDLGNLDIKGTVVWRRWAVTKKNKEPLGFAVKFIHNPNTKKVMDAFYTYLRNKQIMTVSNRIIEEFFGDNKGPRFP
jgi:Tfp pilus assembly protein PilZ